jgi:hypothetical protein
MLCISISYIDSPFMWNWEILELCVLTWVYLVMTEILDIVLSYQASETMDIAQIKLWLLSM